MSEGIPHSSPTIIPKADIGVKTKMTLFERNFPSPHIQLQLRSVGNIEIYQTIPKQDAELEIQV